jgi:hypothetical protein
MDHGNELLPVAVQVWNGTNVGIKSELNYLDW